MRILNNFKFIDFFCSKLIYTTVNFDRAEWRGCVNTTIDATLNANLTAFGDQLLGSYANATDYQTCSKDLCNAPLKCYFCTAGEQSTCKNDDIGGDECLLEATNCAVRIFVVSYKNKIKIKTFLNFILFFNLKDGDIW